jgi:hypothetical protein
MEGLEEKTKMISEDEGRESDESDGYVSSERLVGEIDADEALEAREERLDDYQRRLSKAYSVPEGTFMMKPLRNRKKEIEATLRR